ncbi:MAG: hypothetical protein ACLUP9_07760 [Waltera sp.]|uniref:hypothetical protein n=1 Tax=Waltera sp. TaxID=2815806 RepID=UPI0039941CDB
MAAPEGYNALGKIGISYKGDYDSNTTYERLDAVEHNGSTYLAIKDAPDGAPRDDKVNWIYLAKGFSGDIGDSEITFTEAENRENINTGESVKTVFGKIKKFFADLTAPAFAQMITTKEDLLATKATGYVPDAKAVADAYTELNGKLIAPDYKSAVAIQSNYTCMTNGYVIGTIQGAVNGWASIRSSKNANYFLALCTSSENPIAVCIPFASGDSVIFGSSGTYNLAFAPAK